MDAGSNSDTIAIIRSRTQRNDETLPSCSTSASDGRSEAGGEHLPKTTQNTFKLELPVLLLFFSWNLTATVFQNQILFQTCSAYLSFNDTYCTDLVTNDVVNDETVSIAFFHSLKKLKLFVVFLHVQTMIVEKYAANIFMSRAILENVIPAFISFFIGPWSDKYGRKPILLSTFFGKFTQNISPHVRN